MARARRRDYLASLGWPLRVAERFARLQDATGFQTTFRVSRARISWDRKSGLRTTVDFINYITVREEQADTSSNSEDVEETEYTAEDFEDEVITA